MSQRRRDFDRDCDFDGDRDDPLAHLAAIEAPEFLDALVLRQARTLLEAAPQEANVARVEARVAEPRPLALFARWTRALY